MKKILIIEDDQFFVQTISYMFNENQFQIVTATDGEEGLQKMKELLPDLVLLDFIMPKVNGDEVLKKAKSDPQIKHIPIIVLTSLAVDKTDLINNGAEKCYIKVDLEQEQFVKDIKELLQIPLEEPEAPIQ